MTRRERQMELDGLRLIGLGRVARCSACPRYAGLVDRYRNPQLRASALADVPHDCEYPFCAPIAARFRHTAEPERLRNRSAS